jgi:hypothetical protein
MIRKNANIIKTFINDWSIFFKNNPIDINYNNLFNNSNSLSSDKVSQC